jgi:hypothetical protein
MYAPCEDKEGFPIVPLEYKGVIPLFGTQAIFGS